jgi:NADH dehydrogenase
VYDVRMKKRLIIIGGGYAGLRLIDKLAPTKMYEILLFDIHPYHYMQTEVYDFIANESDFSQITVDLFTYCMGFDEGVSFYKQEVKQIDFENKKVITDINRYSYDEVVIAAGARTKVLESVKGLKEYAHGVKSLNRALEFKQLFERSLYQRIEEEGTYCKMLNIIVAGGGLSGVEIAAQMASFAKEFYHDNHFLCQKLNIIIVNSSPTILHGLSKPLITLSTRRLKHLEIEIINGHYVSEVTPSNVILDDGRLLPKDFMIFTGGIEASPLIKRLDLPKSERGFLLTNDYFEIDGYEGVYAIGDNTTLLDRDNKVIPPTADTAEQMAEHLAKNLIAQQHNRPTTPHRIASRGTMIALGKRYAVTKLLGFYFSGIAAYWLKKLVVKLYFIPLDRRSNRGHQRLFEEQG